MHQPHETRKYQLFPTKDNLSIKAGRKSPDQESTQSTAAVQNGGEMDRAGTASRTKTKEGQSLIRRRKVSIPELGPMTTVQEIAMDSREFSTLEDVHIQS